MTSGCIGQVHDVGGAAGGKACTTEAGLKACTTEAGLKACTAEKGGKACTTTASTKTIADERPTTGRHYSKGARRGVMAVTPQAALRFASALVLIPAAAVAQPAATPVTFT